MSAKKIAMQHCSSQRDSRSRTTSRSGRTDEVDRPRANTPRAAKVREGRTADDARATEIATLYCR